MAKLNINAISRARRTEDAISAALEADEGNRFRALLFKHLPRIEDAYRFDGETDRFRSHLGASQIGRTCSRETWLGYRWAVRKKFPARIIRLLNRGHMEEARFLALLELIGIQLHQPEGGGQERISDHGGHYGSALDAVLWNVPDCPGEWVLGEFKTHNTKSFCELLIKGVEVVKPEHYEQMQSCMGRRGIFKCLYVAVNKNDDDLYCEIVLYNQAREERLRERAADLISRRNAPPRISEDPSNVACAFCDAKQRCHFPEQAPVFRNCRTCVHSVADIPSGTWWCELHRAVLDKEKQQAGCAAWEAIPALMRR